VEGEVISESDAKESSDDGSEEPAHGGPRSIGGEADEDSEEEDQSQPDELTTAFPTGDITPIILRIIIQGRNEIFPRVGGQQHVNENKLIDLYDDIRRAAAELPTVPGEINYGRILTERPPIGSDFTHRGGYKTPEGIIICRTLRNKVKTLQEEFTDEARIQRARAGLARAAGMPQFIQPLIEDGYMEPESRSRFYRPPTPAPSQSEPIPIHEQIESSHRRLRIQPRDAGN
jgi:hypothetical protein